MFVWLLHRISGLLLILLLGLKLFTSYFLMTPGEKPDWALTLHVNTLTDILLTVLIVFHAFYGLRTVVYDLGLKKERLLFWSSTTLATVVSVLLIFVYLSRNY